MSSEALSPTSDPPPAVRKIGFAAPLSWLALGWRDLWRQPAASLAYGVALVYIGILILVATARLPYLFTAALSGFALVAPVLGAGLYEKSRLYLAGEPAPFIATLAAWRRNPSCLFGFAFMALLAGTAWQVISVVLVALLYDGQAMQPLDMVLDILRNPKYSLLFFTYVGVGGMLAAVVFALSVVSMPMLIDRRCALLTALNTSINAVAENPLALALWAFIIMLLISLGFATGMLGLILILPWLAHASFHAYKALVE